MKLWIILSAVIATGWGCGFPGSPAHSSVSLSDEKVGRGTIATYTCDRGFELLGPSRKLCSENGTWTPPGIPFCVLNVAAGKAPMQSSVRGASIPQKAVDGSTSTVFSEDTCMRTEMERNPWWYVNLLEPYMVQLVRIDFGQTCCGDRPAVIEVRVGNNRPDLGANPICNRFEGYLEEGRPLFLPCSPPMPGAFVSVHFVEPVRAHLSICEAFVYTDQALPIERCPTFRNQRPGSTATYNGKCYIFHSGTPLNFDDAFDKCKTQGGSLLDETNPALQGFLSWELWRRHRGDPSGQYWLGAVRDPNDSNNWKWINGRDVTISFWNLPGGNENCARFDGTKGWLWSDTNCLRKLNFVCQHRPKTCGKPEQPPNSTMIANDFNVGSDVMYICDPGHVLVGPSTRKCLNSGFFNEFPPNCQYIECGDAAPIRNGFYELVNGTQFYGSMVRYLCDRGYVIVGRPELVCDIDGRWDGPPPRCEPISCDALPTIENGYSNVSTTFIFYGQSIEFFCNSGYKLSGSSNILTCNEFGELNQSPPSCKADNALKPGLDQPDLAIEDYPGNSLSPTYDVDPMDSRPEDSRPSYVTIRPPFEGEKGGNDVSIRNDKGHSIDSPSYTEGNERPSRANIPLGGIIALGVFGGFVFLAAIITTIVILVRRTQGSSGKKYVRRHDDVTTSSESSSSDGHGLNKYYKRAWDSLGDGGGVPPLSRGTDAEKGHHGPRPGRGAGGAPGDDARGGAGGGDFRAARSISHPEGLRDGSEMTVNDVAAMYTRPDKKRHHHHHHNHRHKTPHDDHDHHDHHDHHDRHDNKDRHDRDWRDRDRRKY